MSVHYRLSSEVLTFKVSLFLLFDDYRCISLTMLSKREALNVLISNLLPLYVFIKYAVTIGRADLPAVVVSSPQLHF